jgi:DNA-binding Xre family transcriptional regulator
MKGRLGDMPVINRVPELAAEKFGGKENINLKEIERETELNYGVVSRWVRGKVDRADFPILEVWCKYFKVGVGEILEYKE